MCSSLEDRLDKCKVALRVSIIYLQQVLCTPQGTNGFYSQQSKNCVKQMLMIDFAKRLAFDPDKEVKVYYDCLAPGIDLYG